jgi:hypothetical protein
MSWANIRLLRSGVRRTRRLSCSAMATAVFHAGVEACTVCKEVKGRVAGRVAVLLKSRRGNAFQSMSCFQPAVVQMHFDELVASRSRLSPFKGS